MCTSTNKLSTLDVTITNIIFFFEIDNTAKLDAIDFATQLLSVTLDVNGQKKKKKKKKKRKEKKDNGQKILRNKVEGQLPELTLTY